MNNNFNNAKLIRYLLLILLGWAIAQILAYFETILIIFIFAAILAFLLSYPVRWLENFLSNSWSEADSVDRRQTGDTRRRKKFRTRPLSFYALSVCLVFLLSILSFTLVALTLGFAVLSQGQQIIDQLPKLLDELLLVGEQFDDLLAKLNFPVNIEIIQIQLRNYALSQIGLSLAIFPKIFTNLVDLILIAVVAFFMLLDGAKLWLFCLKLFPSHLHNKITVAVKRNFLGFFWGRLILSAFFGISVFLVLFILKIPYALALAVISGIFDLIPGIGATLGIMIVALIILPQGIWLSLTVIVGCILLQQVEENLLMPRIMQGSLDLNPVVMFLALLLGAQLAGLVGIFLAIPIAGVIINLLEIDEIKVES